jgi:hypothetical protein
MITTYWRVSRNWAPFQAVFYCSHAGKNERPSGFQSPRDLGLAAEPAGTFPIETLPLFPIPLLLAAELEVNWPMIYAEWLTGGRVHVNCVLDALRFYRRRIRTNGKQETKHIHFPRKHTLHSKRSPVSYSVFLLPHDHPTKEEQGGRFLLGEDMSVQHQRPVTHTHHTYSVLTVSFPDLTPEIGVKMSHPV